MSKKSRAEKLPEETLQIELARPIKKRESPETPEEAAPPAIIQRTRPSSPQEFEALNESAKIKIDPLPEEEIPAVADKLNADPMPRAAKRKAPTSQPAQPAAPLNLTKVPVSTIFQKIPIDQVKRLFLLAVVAQLALTIYNYFTLTQKYLQYGGGQALLYFSVVTVGLFIGNKMFFDATIGRCQTLLHVVLLFFCPVIINDIALNTYLSASINFSGFDRWFYYYHQGVNLRLAQKEQAAQNAFIASLQDLDPADNQTVPLLLKSKYFLLLQQKKKTAPVQQLANTLKLRSEMPHDLIKEKLGLTREALELYVQLKGYSAMLKLIDETLKIYENTDLPADGLYNDFLYYKLLALLHSNARDRYMAEEMLELWNQLSPVLYKQLEQAEKRPWALRQLMTLIQIYTDYQQYDLALENWLTLLDAIRDLNYFQEMKTIYQNLTYIYRETGEKVKSDLYANKVIDMELLTSQTAPEPMVPSEEMPANSLTAPLDNSKHE